MPRFQIFGRWRFWGYDMIFSNGDVDGDDDNGDFHHIIHVVNI